MMPEEIRDRAINKMADLYFARWSSSVDPEGYESVRNDGLEFAEQVLREVPELLIVEPKEFCPKCGFNKTQKYGLRNSKTGIKRRYWCRNCASVFYKPLKQVG